MQHNLDTVDNAEWPVAGSSRRPLDLEVFAPECATTGHRSRKELGSTHLPTGDESRWDVRLSYTPVTINNPSSLATQPGHPIQSQAVTCNLSPVITNNKNLSCHRQTAW